MARVEPLDGDHEGFDVWYVNDASVSLNSP